MKTGIGKFYFIASTMYLNAVCKWRSCDINIYDNNVGISCQGTGMTFINLLSLQITDLL